MSRFGTVGLVATATHVLMFVLTVEALGLAPLLANFTAFAVAVSVSFFGHYLWTFRQETGGQGVWTHRATRSLVKFTIVALTGLALNSLAVLLVVEVLGLSYIYAVGLMLTAVPACIFVVSKFWAFT